MPYSQTRNPFSSPLEKITKEERKKSRAERKEFRQERRAERKNKKEIRKTTVGKDRNFRKADEGAGMTPKGVEAYKAKNPGSKLKTAVTGDVKPGSKDAKRRKSFCARSKGWTGERGKAARRRWKC
jgi:L,D-peptidoglycan transpeptidase YkuD (ErfK/YbiS/YcfS/YnhG family)